MDGPLPVALWPSLLGHLVILERLVTGAQVCSASLSVVSDVAVVDCVWPGVVACSSVTAVSGVPILVDSFRPFVGGAPFVWAPPEQTLFADVSLH